MMLVILFGYIIIRFPPIISLLICHARAFLCCVHAVEELFNSLKRFKTTRGLDYFNFRIIRNRRFFIPCIFYFACIQLVNYFSLALVYRTHIDVNPFDSLSLTLTLFYFLSTIEQPCKLLIFCLLIFWVLIEPPELLVINFASCLAG